MVVASEPAIQDFQDASPGAQDVSDALNQDGQSQDLSEHNAEIDDESGHVLINSPDTSELASDASLAGEAEHATDIKERLSGCILVIDVHESLLRGSAVSTLRTSGFEVREAMTLVDAIQTFNNEKVSVIMHNWASVNGTEAVEMHRQLAGYPGAEAVVRLFLTEDSSAEFFALACDLGADKVMDAKAELVDLPDTIRQCLEQKSDDLEFAQLVGATSPSGQYNESELDERIVRVYASGPKSRRVQLEFGAYLLRCAKLDEAESLAAQLTKTYPSDPRCMNFMARVFMKQKRFSRAVECLRRADVVSPDNPERLVMIGDALFEKGEFGEAKKSYEDAIALNPETPGAQKGLGRSLFHLGDVDAALSCFRKCLSEDETASFFNNAAVLAVKAKRISEGLRLYDTALNSLHTEKYAHIILFNIGLALYRAGDLQKAAETIKASLGYRPDFEKSQRLLEGIELRAAS